MVTAPNLTAELGLTYWREGLDKFEAHYLAPANWNGDLTSDAPKGLPLAHVQMHYSPAHVFRSGGAGDVRPDSFKAFVWDAKLGRDRALGHFSSMREAKRAILLALRDPKSGATPRIAPAVNTIKEH